LNENPKDSGTVTVLSVIGFVFGLMGMLGSFIPCIGIAALYISIPSAIISGLALLTAYSHKAKRTFAFVSLTISLIGISISAWQYYRIASLPKRNIAITHTIQDRDHSPLSKKPVIGRFMEARSIINESTLFGNATYFYLNKNEYADRGNRTVSPNGNYYAQLICDSHHITIEVYDLIMNSLVISTKYDTNDNSNPFRDVAFSFDNKYILAIPGYRDDRIYIFDYLNNKSSALMTDGHDDPNVIDPHAVFIRNSNSFLVTHKPNKGAVFTVATYDINTLKLLHTYPISNDEYFSHNGSSVAFNMEANLITFFNRNGIMIYDLESEKVIRRYPNINDARLVSFDDKQKILATLESDDQIKLYDMDTSDEMTWFRIPDVSSFSFQPGNEVTINRIRYIMYKNDYEIFNWNRDLFDLLMITTSFTSPEKTEIETTQEYEKRKAKLENKYLRLREKSALNLRSALKTVRHPIRIDKYNSDIGIIDIFVGGTKWALAVSREQAERLIEKRNNKSGLFLIGSARYVGKEQFEITDSRIIDPNDDFELKFK
jgi:hypothetical protein